MAEPVRRSPFMQQQVQTTNELNAARHAVDPNARDISTSESLTGIRIDIPKNQPQPSFAQRKPSTVMFVGVVILLVGIIISILVPKDNLVVQLIGIAVSTIIGGLIIRHGYKNKPHTSLLKRL